MTDPASFRALLNHLSSAAHVSLRMPERVFGPNYTRFHFFEFDTFSADEFWRMLQQLMIESRDQKVTLAVLNPDPERYFYDNFGRFGLVDIPLNSSAQQYRHLLQDGPGPPPDNLMDNSMVLVWFPPSLQWLIWGERDTEIMVLACERSFKGANADTVGTAGVSLLTAEDALDISSGAWRDRGARKLFAHRLMENYAGGQPWKDDACDRAIALARKLIADEIGVIEASRSLSSMRYEFDAPLRDLFLPFVGIDSESDGLPTGPVRREWEPGALARKDVEIARYEQAVRQCALEASRKLIEQLLGQEEH
jgi:hypothetical protein